MFLQNFYCPIICNSDARLPYGQNTRPPSSLKQKGPEFNLGLQITWLNESILWPASMSKKYDPFDYALRLKWKITSGSRCYVQRCKFALFENKSPVYECTMLEFKAFPIINIEFTFSCLGTIQSYYLK